MNSYYHGEPLRIGNATQLFIDDGMIEDRWRLQRVLQQPDKFVKNPIIVRDKPWESDMTQCASVVWDEAYGRYRMWYLGFCLSNYYYGSGPVSYVCYAESDDGYNWEKPLTDRFPFGKYKKTNIVYWGTHDQGTYVFNTDPDAVVTRLQVADKSQVFVDEKDPDPARRYKMISTEGRPRPDLNEVHTGVQLVCSPDGFHWSLAGDRALYDYCSDCLNHVVRDEKNDQWIMYCRPTIWHSGRQHGPRNIRRRVAAMTSKDLVNWDYPRVVMYPDEYDTPDYDHVLVFPYGDQFLMLYGAMEGDTTATWELRLATSRDGFHWERYHTRETYLGSGAPGSWDMGILPSTVPIRQDERLLLYYSGFNRGQEEQGDFMAAIGLATIKLDRFVEQRARDVTGYLLTKEFIFEGNTLRVNCELDKRTSRNPRLRVEILRHPPHGQHWGFQQAYEGFSLDDCDPLCIDHTEAVVTWRGSKNLSALRGKPVYLRFELEDMGLYAFRVSEE